MELAGNHPDLSKMIYLVIDCSSYDVNFAGFAYMIALAEIGITAVAKSAKMMSYKMHLMTS